MNINNSYMYINYFLCVLSGILSNLARSKLTEHNYMTVYVWTTMVAFHHRATSHNPTQGSYQTSSR